MLNLNSVLLFSQNPKELGSFYAKILGKEPEWSGGDFVGFKVGESYLTIGPHSEVGAKNPEPERMMINFETEDVEGDFEKIKDLGASVVKEPYHPKESPNMSIATFEDPDGNYFQLTSPMEM